MAIFIFIIFAGFLFSGDIHLAQAYTVADAATDAALFVPKALCVMLLQLGSWLLGAAAALFGFAADADKLTAVIANPALYAVWKEVRDFLNMAFILFLLYASFSIIFQVGGKYGEKKILLTIVLMALLVNFSFPITRFIIDVSNSLMYTLLSQFFPDSATDPQTILTGITQSTALATILTADTGASLTQLVASVIFVFILALTFLAFAILLLIRIVALAIIIVSSPVAFVGSIAGKDFGWWDYLFKYAFFGPVMIFILHIAVFIMQAMGESAKLTMPTGSTSDASIITAIGQFIIPIIILWMGMGVAQKFGIEGAGAVVGKAQGWAKSFGLGATVGAWRSTGIPGGFKKAKDYYGAKGAGALPGPLKHLGKVPGFRGSDKTKEAEGWIASRLTRDKGYDARKLQSDMLADAKKYKDDVMQPKELEEMCTNGDAAACYRLAEDGKMNANMFGKMTTNTTMDSALKETVNKLINQKRADLVARHKALHDTKTQDTARARFIKKNGRHPSNDELFVEGMSGEISKLDIEKFASQDWAAFEADFNSLTASEQALITKALDVAWNTNYRDEARREGRKRLSGASVAALNSMGLTV